ncbi:hypothetical protein WA026_015599 [Henosepilachna vigintioctopunctata]|uniref:Mitochondrial 2-oxodicarboxylate carrier n=1 Tax=Henosepilachna vigintioctopunctata TaxID=420089 RepID=A0AAW1VEK8_9CUCU
MNVNMPNEKFNDSFQYFLSGCTASAILICGFYPLDLVKTRLQIQSGSRLPSKNDSTYYYGTIDCILKMYKKEGVLSFWKGVLPPLLVHTPRRGLKFLVFEEFKSYSAKDLSIPYLRIYICGAAITGILEGILMTPFEVVKIMLQANKSTLEKSPSSWTMTKKIVSEKGFGLNGLFKGLTATIWKMTTHNIWFFGTFYSAHDMLERRNNKVKFSEKVSIGVIASILATVFTIPLDVAKSRIQCPESELKGKTYKWALPTMYTIYKEEGWKALSKGLSVKILRHAPGGAIMLVMNEYMNKYFSTKLK